MSDDTSDVENTTTEEYCCTYCGEEDRLNLTTCDNCNITFCLYCVGRGGTHDVPYDVCPKCGDSFAW